MHVNSCFETIWEGTFFFNSGISCWIRVNFLEMFWVPRYQLYLPRLSVCHRSSFRSSKYKRRKSFSTLVQDQNLPTPRHVRMDSPNVVGHHPYHVTNALFEKLFWVASRLLREVDWGIPILFWRLLRDWVWTFNHLESANASLTHVNTHLVGGFNPSEKYLSNWESSPNGGEKKYLKPPASHLLIQFWIANYAQFMP